MHHVIWVEHDGSWTWSIEEGKAFDDDHKVLARDEGFPTRGDAKEDMLKAWSQLIDEGKKPGRPGQRKTTAVAKSQPKKKTTGSGKNAKSAAAEPAFSAAIPEWAVIVDGTVAAMFAQKTAAQKYAKANHAKNHDLKKIQIGLIGT